MFATVHIADRGLRAVPAWRSAARGIRGAHGLAYDVVCSPAPLGETTRPQLRRLAHVAFWADRDSADDALAGEPFGAGGLRMGLQAVRAIGSWPGLPADLPTDPAPVHDGPSVVITIGRLRLLQARRFFVAGSRAERHVAASPGLTWGTGLAAPERRTLLTLSWWHDFAAMDETARGAGAHLDAMKEQDRKDFHHESAFIRFQPVHVSGRLGGRNGVQGLAV